jgi:hypothetical protein
MAMPEKEKKQRRALGIALFVFFRECAGDTITVVPTLFTVAPGTNCDMANKPSLHAYTSNPTTMHNGYTLLAASRQIDGDKLQSLNTKTGHGIESCLRPPCQIGGSASYLETDGDEQAILSVSFTEGVCLKSVCIVNSGESSPKKVKLFVDREVGDHPSKL